MEKNLLNDYVKELEELKAEKEAERENENEDEGRFFPDFRNFLK